MSTSNPLVQESLIDKVSKSIKVKKRDEKLERRNKIVSHFIGMNNTMPVCAEACACCWDKQIPEAYEDIAEYVAKRSRTGHTSIVEHSNFIMMLEVGDLFYPELIDFLSICRYLKAKVISNVNQVYVYLYGSLRAYADIYRMADDLNNPIVSSITGTLYCNANSAAFEDIIALGLMDKSLFQNPNVTENADYYLISSPTTVIDTDLFKVVSMDDLTKLYTKIYNDCPEAASKLSTFDLCEMATLTILFKNMSRTCTHQLVRHRNAITQESQRYVDYTDSCFSSPALFKPEKYDAAHKYRIQFGSSSPMNMTLDEIGQAICKIYSQLHDPAVTGGNHALMREDARAFLPSNVQCKKIYMTFTYKNFLKFLNLREDIHAQAEIRKYAVATGDWFRSCTQFNTKELCDLYTMPRLLIEDPVHIDVDLGTTEEKVTMTEEAYVEAAGLGNNSNSEGE